MLLIYLPKKSSRCEYIFDLIFTEEFAIDYRVTTDITEFNQHAKEKINYSFSKIANEFFIKASSLLFENEIKKQEIKVEQKHGTKVLFPDKNEDLGFDIFSAVFYLISAYEEYLSFTPDEFGRFKAEDSLAFKNNFLHIPVVDAWINIFRIALQNKFPALQIKPAVFNAIATYDIDVAYKYCGRNFVRNTGSVVKDILSFKIKNITERLNVLRKKEKDPWDVYEDLKMIISENNLPCIFFFLLGDKSAHDRNLDYQNRAMKKLINKTKSFAETGIHPSFYSSLFPEKILIEKERLEKLAGKKIIKSRQHYLKFILPDTYNSLLAAGITEDYSMGFSKLPGFRAGTCKPFYFYDLKNEKATNLKIYPITFMESTVMNNSSNPDEAFQKIMSLLEEVKKVNGTFISLWHNHTISKTEEYKEWKKVHGRMIQKLVDSLR
ncbi:MAG: polysaccharide deacetylase family protein [Ginsengibacter sp.]